MSPGCDRVGILPAGALGAAFFYHLTDGLTRAGAGEIGFVARAGGSPAGDQLRFSPPGSPDTIVTLPYSDIGWPTLAELAGTDRLPGILLVVTQTDRILPVVREYVGALEILYRRHAATDWTARAPALVLCSNGIFHLRVRRYFVEALEESALYGRLPDMWEGDLVNRLVGRLLRGVTIQTGRRDGDGADAVHRVGMRGRTRLAGGAPDIRRATGRRLAALGGYFEVEETAAPTRVEFDKALVNLAGNLLGLLASIDDDGVFRALKVKEIFPTADSPETRELMGHVIAVGRSVGAYGKDEDFGTLYHAAMKAARGPLEHTPSSIAWVAGKLATGDLEPRLSPTEAWLLDPLIAFAHAASIGSSEDYFKELVRRVEARLALARARALT